MHSAAAAEYPGLRPGYLDTASYGLPPVATVNALRTALDSWSAGTADWASEWDASGDRCRELVSPMLGLPPSEIALQPAVSVGAAIALSAIRSGDEILVVRDEFASILLPTLAAARRAGASVRRVEFSALTDSITPRTALVLASHVRSNDGRVQDLAALGAAAARAGTRVLIDATHSAGVLPIHAAQHGIHYVLAAAYKHMLCPRGVAFLGISSTCFKDTAPIAASWRGVSMPHDYYGSELSHLLTTAARYDVSLAWHSWVGAAQSLAFLAKVPPEARRDWCVGLAGDLAEQLRVLPTGSSVISLRVEDIVAARNDLSAAGIVCSGRGGFLRLSFHLYNDSQDAAVAAQLLRRHLIR